MMPHITAAAALNTHTKTAVHNVSAGVATVHRSPPRWSHKAVVGTPAEAGLLKLSKRRETSTETLGDLDEESVIDMREHGRHQDEDSDHNTRRHTPSTSPTPGRRTLDAPLPTPRFPQSGYKPYSIDFTHYASPVTARTPDVAHNDASSPATPLTRSRSPSPPPSPRRAPRPPPIDIEAAQAYQSKKRAQIAQLHQHTHMHVHEHVHDNGVQHSVADAVATDIRERPQGPRPNNDKFGLASATADPFGVSLKEIGMAAAESKEARSRAVPAANPPAGTTPSINPATFPTQHQTATSDLPPPLPSEVDLRAIQPADGAYPSWYPTWGRKPSPYASNSQEDDVMHDVALTPAHPGASAAAPHSPLSPWRKPLGGAYSAVKNAASRGSAWLESKPRRVHFGDDAAERGEASPGARAAPVSAPVAGVSYAFQNVSPKRVDIDARPKGYRSGPAPWEKKKEKKGRAKWIVLAVLILALIVGLAVGFSIKKSASNSSDPAGTATGTSSGSTKGAGTSNVSNTIVDQCVSALAAGMVDGLDCAMCAPAFANMTAIPPGTNSSPGDIKHAHPRILQYCALEDLAATTSNDAYAYLLNNGWTSSLDPCGSTAWEGIECNDDGLVTGLTIGRSALPSTIPQSLSNIVSLESVEIEGNATLPHGAFPSGVLEGLGLLSITNTSLSAIAFDGTVQLPNLTVLRLASNPVAGLDTDVPDFSNFTSLTSLTISNAGLSSLDPTHLPASLQYLDLSSNSLRDRLPTLEHLTSLKTLYLQSNNFVAPPPSLPASLETLSLASNQGLKGNMPLGTCNSTKLTECDLRGTQVMGTLGTPTCGVCTFT